MVTRIFVFVRAVCNVLTMSSGRRSLPSIEEHLQLGLPVLFSELLVFKWTPVDGFPPVSEEFRAGFERMQEVENLENELRVFFDSFGRALEALEGHEVRRNTFKFLDQYGTIADILKNDLLRVPSPSRSLVPEYLEERIRSQAKWFRGDDDDFSLDFAKEFLRRKFCTMRNSFRAPQPTSLLPPVPPPRRNRSGSVREPEPSTSQAVSMYTASGRLRRNSAPTNSSPKPRRMTAEELPSPPPTPPPLRQEAQEIGIAQENEVSGEFVEAESRDEEAQRVPSTPEPVCLVSSNPAHEHDQEIPQQVIEEVLESNNNDIDSDRHDDDRLKHHDEEQPAVKSKIKNPVISDVLDRPLQETAM